MSELQSSAAQLQLFQAASRGDAKAVSDLITAGGVDVRVRDKGNRTALHLACKEARIEVVSVLLPHCVANSIDINTPDRQGYTPLIFAEGRRWMIDSKHDAKAVEEYAKHHKEIVAMFLSLFTSSSSSPSSSSSTKVVFGTSYEHRDKSTALHDAGRYGAVETAKLLLERGSASLVNKKAKDGCTALHYAMSNTPGHRHSLSQRWMLEERASHIATVKLLLVHGIDVNHKGRPRRDIAVTSPLCYDNFDESDELSNLLIEAGSDLSAEGAGWQPWQMPTLHAQTWIYEKLKRQRRVAVFHAKCTRIVRAFRSTLPIHVMDCVVTYGRAKFHLKERDRTRLLSTIEKAVVRNRNVLFLDLFSFPLKLHNAR